MFVQSFMTRDPVTIHPDLSLSEAQGLLKREKIHRLPVVDRTGHLVGILSEKDILGVLPSPASTLDRYEISGLLAGIKVEKIMHRPVITVTPDTPVEEAARLMADNNIGGLPVVKDASVLTGIITESDLFRLFVDMCGARTPGLRLTVRLAQSEGVLARLADALAARSANIIAICSAPGSDPTNLLVTLKLDGITEPDLRSCLESLVLELVDLRHS